MAVAFAHDSPRNPTQGSFDSPCVYLNDTDGAGFDSGLQSGKQFTIRITNDQERRQNILSHLSLVA